jgi:hypothetical protein
MYFIQKQYLSGLQGKYSMKTERNMKMNFKKLGVALSLAGVSAVSSLSATAAEVTAIKGDNSEFSAANPAQTLMVRGDSFYNLTMGYKGWTHHSAWMHMKLQHGQQYRITATVTDEFNGEKVLHPAIACWHRPQREGLVSTDYAYSHFYNQWEDIVDPNAVDEVTKQPLGQMKMYFIKNAYDRDGLTSQQMTEQYQQGNLVGVLDGQEGKVEITFVPQVSGVYQCVVGGFNPEPPINSGAAAGVKYPVEVSVTGF